MIKNKVIRAILVLVLVAVICVTCAFIYKEYSREANDVKSVHVKMSTETKMVYGKNEFDVTKAELIDHVLDFVKAYGASQETKGHKKDEKENYTYELTVNYRNGNRASYKIKEESVPQGNELEDVLAAEEVVKQVRSFYTVEVEKVKMAELCKWSDNATNDVKKEQITNMATIQNIFRICKEYTLSDPIDSGTFKRSEIYFYNKKGKVVAAFYFSKDSKCYKELVKAVPDIDQFV